MASVCLSIPIIAVAIALASTPLHAENAGEPRTPTVGYPKTAGTMVLEAGARILQDRTPLEGFSIYLVGFHPMKDHPEVQVEAHHYCHQVNEDFAQCVLFDSNARDARMHGLEYIISEKLFDGLPEPEKKYWHPHNGEILSGQLIAPGIPAAAEKSLMKRKMNSYGKTWHVWNTGHAGNRADMLPFGDPMLAWSFNRDGEAMPALIEKRDKDTGVDSDKVRMEREDLREIAKPQQGVDTLKGRFGRPTREIPGVTEKRPPG